jgi:hypothetical protein
VPGRDISGSGFPVTGAGFRVPGFQFQVPGSGFRVPGSGFRVSGTGCRRHAGGGPGGPFPSQPLASSPSLSASGSVLRVSGFRIQVSGFVLRVSGFRIQVSGFGSRFAGFRFRVSDFGFTIEVRGERPTPTTKIDSKFSKQHFRSPSPHPRPPCLLPSKTGTTWFSEL